MRYIKNNQPKQKVLDLQRQKVSTVTKISRKFMSAMSLVKGESGFSLVESLVSVIVFGVITAAFFSSLGTSFKILFTTDERQTAKSLAESQLEYVKGFSGLLPSYSPQTPIPAEYTGYSVEIWGDDVVSRDNNIQKIRVLVSHQGKPIILAGNSTLEGFKVR